MSKHQGHLQEEPVKSDFTAFEAETAAAVEAAEQERQAALARGDIFEPEPEPEALQPDFLKTLATEEQPVQTEESPTIPKARFDELAQQNKAMKEELERLKQSALLPEQPAEVTATDNRTQLKSLREQRRDADLEGDFEQVMALDEQIDELRIQIAKDEINASLNSAKVATTLQQVATASYERYPFLDNASASADSDAIAAVINRRDELHRAGKPLVEALQLAIDEKGPKFAKLLGVPQKEQLDERTIAARHQAAAASLQQPPALRNRMDTGEFQLDVSKMTEKQIMALPEEVRAKLRGDVL